MHQGAIVGFIAVGIIVLLAAFAAYRIARSANALDNSTSSLPVSGKDREKIERN